MKAPMCKEIREALKIKDVTTRMNRIKEIIEGNKK
jgi:hypothetical protein